MTDETRVQGLTAVLEQKSAELSEGLEKAVKIDGNNLEIKREDFEKMQNLRGEINEIKGLISDEYIDVEVKNFLAQFAKEGETGGSVAMAAAAGAQGVGSLSLPQIKSLGTMFVESEVFTEFAKSGLTTMERKFELDLQDIATRGTYGQKDVYNALGNHSFDHGFGRIQFDPLVPRGQRAARIRDLFPVASTNANLIDFFQVTGFSENGGDGAAAPVADRTGTAPNEVFGLKPKSNLIFAAKQAPVRTIAHWEAAHRNVIADEPQLRSTIDNELLYGLALEEDNQILNGDGTGENLLGLLNTPGLQTYTQAESAPNTPSELKSDALRRAATKAIVANYAPTGYVLNPYDWEDVELQKGGETGSGADGDGQYMLITNVAIGAAQQVWRQPVVESPVMPEGTFVTGAWGIGAQLYDREQASVRISEHHADFFVRNAIAILVEERLAFAVKRPESFVKGTFTDLTP
jgi:HK97 family phage major capsid protein